MRASICLSTYNKARYLERVLWSIFRQRPPFDWEVLVCDDGSTDDTRKVCKDFPVRYFHLDRKGYRNPAAARNVTYRAAMGKVVIAQSDDVLHVYPDTMDRLVKALSPGRFVIASVTNVDWGGKPYCDPKGKGWGDKLQEYTGPGCRRPLFFLGALWRADLWAVGGNDEEFTTPGWEDNWFADCLMKGRGLEPDYAAGIVGHHLHHPHTQDWGGIKKSHALYLKKTTVARANDVWCSSGGPWGPTENGG